MRNPLLKFTWPLLLLVLGIYSCKDDDNDPPLIKPSISELSPGTGAIGTPVTVRGLNFGANPIVKFGTTTADVPSGGSTTTSITTKVPEGLAAGTVEVTVTNDGSVSDGETFTVTEAGGGTGGTPPATAGDTLSGIADLSTLATAVETTGLKDALNDADKVTIFAPNNAAFDALLSTIGLDDLDALVAALTSDTVSSILQAHVVADSLGSAELTDGKELKTLNNKTITIANDGTTITANGAEVVERDIIVGNGVIHVIDSVINIPGSGEVDSLANAGSALDTIPDLETLNMAVDAIDGLTEALDSAEKVTIFAPNNAAFTALLGKLGLNDLPGLIAAITAEGVDSTLQAHVVGDSLGSADLTDGLKLATLNNDTITIANNGTIITANGAQVLTPDITVGNGVIHIIDAVINTEAAAVGSMITYNEALDSLEIALTAADLIGTLNDETAEYTVFAPNNAAFAQASADNNVESIAELVAALESQEAGSASKLLLGHVVSGIYPAGQLANGQTLTALNGNTLTIELSENGVSVNGIAITNTDDIASNGLIHTITGVIPQQ